MLEIVNVDDVQRWNSIVKKYRNWDIYYLNEYAVSFQIHGDGTPILLNYENENEHFCYVVMKRDIAQDPRFMKNLKEHEYYDFETPYGYGGPLTDSAISARSERDFYREITDFAKEEGVVSQFVRFHPLLNNYNLLPEVFETRYMHKTVYIDTSSNDIIMSNMDTKNRNMVRKAIKNGVTIERRPITDYNAFIPIYKETMLRDNASEYYYFGEEYYEKQKDMSENSCIFYAIVDNKPIAAAIVYYNENYMHYHLAGTRSEYRKFSPSNLLLYEAACWASDRGIKK